MGFFVRKDRDKPLPSPPVDDITTPTSHASTRLQTSTTAAASAATSASSSPSLASHNASLPSTSARTMNRSSAGTAGTSATTASSTSGSGANTPGTPLTSYSHLSHHHKHPPFSHYSSSGSNANFPRPPDPTLDPAGYLRSLPAVRDRSRIIGDKALRNELSHFDVDMSKFVDVTTFVAQIIKRDYDPPYTTNIPAHGRYQHFSVGGRDRIALLLATWPAQSVDNTERCRRLIDLIVVSVLLDASAGTNWKYKSHENGRVYSRSEGLAIASLDMFKAGLFSGHQQSNRTQVDKDGLKALTVAALAKGLQSTEGNAVEGLEGRASLLIRLGDALASHPEIYGPEGRPGNMVDYLVAHPTTKVSSKPIVMLTVLWDMLMDSLAFVWPDARTAVNGIPLGDAWPCSDMPQPASVAVGTAITTDAKHKSASPSSSPTSKAHPTFSPFPTNNTRASHASSSGASSTAPPVEPWEAIVPFHKITQWLAYSLMQPMESLLKIHFSGTELLTGLAEYRNGGLFIDIGVLTLKEEDVERGLEHYRAHAARQHTSGVEVAPMFDTGDDVVVEWRAVTVCFLDKLCADVNRMLAGELQTKELTLAQLLEAGSWKGGREMAEMSRPNTKEPPILIDSDGTVF